MITCYIGIGSNVGDRERFIGAAIMELKAIPGINFKRCSSIYETDPVSDIPQGKFLNGVIEIDTDLEPRALLKELNEIEDWLYRQRGAKNAPRTMDLDILYYGDAVIEEEGLIIPHPRIAQREFVLKGLRELGRV